MKYALLFLAIVFLFPLVNADIIFFDKDNTLIVGPTTDSGATGGAISRISKGSCSYKWNCYNFSECLPSGKQTRNCVNVGTCSDAQDPPEREQNCSYIAPKVEKVKELENEEINKPNETYWDLIKKDIAGRNKLIVYSLFFLIIALMIFCLERIFKRLIHKKIKNLNRF